MARHATLTLAALAALLAGACVPDTEERARRHRWIEQATEELLEVEDLVEIVAIQEWRFGGQKRPGSFENSSILAGGSGDDLQVRPRDGAPRWRPESVRRAAVDAAVVSAIEVRMSGLERGRVSVIWERDGAEVGRKSLDRLWARGEKRDRFVFDLEGQIPSGGDVTIAIELTDAPGEIVGLRGIRFGRLRADAERRAQVSSRPWKVSLENDLRSVLVAPAEGVISRRVRIGRGARFSVGFGLLGEPASPVTYRAYLIDDGRMEELFRGAADARTGSAWQDYSVDLSRYREQEMEIELSVEAPPQAGDRFVALWAGPELSRDLDAAESRPNVVLISLDTLRADRLSLYGYDRATSPRLDRWAARNAVTFRNVIAPSGWTLPSHTSLMTGLEAFRHPANFDALVPRTGQFDFLAEILRENGYRSQAFTGGGFVHPLYGFGQGFDSYVSWPSRHERDAELSTHVARALDWLAQRGREPFFLFFHTFEVHTPNRARQPYFKAFSKHSPELEAVPVGRQPEPAEGFLGRSDWRLAAAEGHASELPEGLESLPSDLYDSAVAFMDQHLGDLLDGLSRLGYSDRTIVVVTSDHGEALGEGGRASHGHLFESNLRIPLLVALPRGVGAGRWVDGQVRLIDVFPTVLELTNARVPAGVDGRSLVRTLREGAKEGGRAAWSYAASTNDGLALTDGRGRKLVWRDTVWQPIAGSSDLLDVRAGGEGQPMLGTDSERLRESMETTARRFFGAVAAGAHLELYNRSRGVASITLETPLVAPVSVKSPDLSAPYLKWKNMGAVDLDLDPGARSTLVFQQVESDRIGVAATIRFVDCAEATLVYVGDSLDRLATPRRVSGRSTCASDRDAVDLQLRWVGRPPEGKTVALDEELLSELRALGYLR